MRYPPAVEVLPKFGATLASSSDGIFVTSATHQEMFGRVYTAALLAAVILTAVTRVEDTVKYSPWTWCSCKVSAQLTVLLPRPTPCRRHTRKHENGRLYLVLLLLLAGDVELNPGPGPAHTQDSIEKIQGDEDTGRFRCSVCNVIIERLMLRSRVVEDAVKSCEVTDCTSVAHHRCVSNSKKCRTFEWTCDRHSEPHDQLNSVEHQSSNANTRWWSGSSHRSASAGADDVPAQPSCTEPGPITGPVDVLARPSCTEPGADSRAG